MSKSLGLTLTTALVCLAVGGNAWCDEAPANAERQLRTSLPVSGYPDRWCIKTYIAESRRPARPLVSRTPSSSTVAYRHVPARLVQDIPGEFDDRSSLLERLKALRSLRLATLWQGRHRSLVVGVQDGGYFGVGLDKPGNDDAP